MRSELIGYADRFSYSPADRIRVMARTDQAKYRATIVRLIHGDENPEGPGFKEQVLETDINGEYPGRKSRLLLAVPVGHDFLRVQAKA